MHLIMALFSKINLQPSMTFTLHDSNLWYLLEPDLYIYINHVNIAYINRCYDFSHLCHKVEYNDVELYRARFYVSNYMSINFLLDLNSSVNEILH